MSNLRPTLYLLRPFWRRVLLSLLLGVLTVGSGVALMMTSAWLISTAALQLGIASLGVAPTAVRFFGLSRAVFRYLERLVSHDVTFRLLSQLRVWCYASLEPLSLVQLQAFRSGDLMARIVSDIEELQNFYLRVVYPPLVALVITSTTGLIFALIDKTTALVLVSCMLLSGTILPWFTWLGGRHAGAQVVKGRTELKNQLVDAVQGLPDRLAFGAGADLRAGVAQENSRLSSWERRLGLLDGLQAGLSVLLLNLTAVVVLWVALDRVDGVLLASLTLGAIAAFEAITPLAQAGQNGGKEEVAAGRILDVLEHSAAIGEPADPAQVILARPHLQLHDVTFGYGCDEPPVLTHFNLDVPFGQCVLVTGASGTGKSSLINILLRFAEYEAGEVRLDGHDIRGLSHGTVRQSFAVMTQRTHLFNTTIRENIRLGRKAASEAEVVAAAEAAHIHAFIRSLPDGYDTLVGEGGALLSGGERQRLALARILLKNAPIWLLDEITANLDPITAVAVMRSVLAAGRERTLLLITHRPQLVRGYPFAQQVRLNQTARTAAAQKAISLR